MNTQYKKGVLELCVLSLLHKRDCYGYEISDFLSQHIDIADGTVYPILRKLKSDGLLTTYLQEESGGPANKKEFYLLMIVGDKRLVTKDVSKKLGTSRLSFASESYMEEYLDITPGSVSVLGLMNDTENHVQLVIDEDVLKGEYVGCHPCINTSSLRVRTADLMEKIIPAMHHEAKIIRI